MTIGNCYQDAFELLQDHAGTDARLAHGTCTGQGPIKGIAFGHSWLELGPLVFAVIKGKTQMIPKDIYYTAGACRKVHLYTREEACIMALKHKHFGPWNSDSKKAAHHEKKPLTRNKGLGKLHKGK